MANEISDLVFSFLKMASIPHREIVGGVWKAEIPESEKNFFNGEESLMFTFDRKTAEEHRDIELIGEGSFLLRKIIDRISSVPKVCRIFLNKDPEMAPKTIGVVTSEAHYRAKVAFNFKVSFDSDNKHNKLYSVTADTADESAVVAEGMYEPDEGTYSEEPNPEIQIEEAGHDILKLYVLACQKLEDAIAEEVELCKENQKKEYENEVDIFDKYIDEQKDELLKKKENVSFHLYFFQKEEEIDKLIKDLEEERKRKVCELQEKYRMKVNISLIDAVVIEIPTMGVVSSKKVRKVK